MSTNPLLPALIPGSAKDMALAIEPSVVNPAIYDLLPAQLKTFVDSRLRIASDFEQDNLPGVTERTALDTTFLKVITQNTRNKSFRGEELSDGTVLGRTPIYKPSKKKGDEESFPFILLHAWVERAYGTWDQDNERMTTYCASADADVPSMRNTWGAQTCKACPHNGENRKDYKDETEEERRERCKRIYNLFGVGGDFGDFYVLQIKGQSIMSVYYKGIQPHLKNLARDRLPCFTMTFDLTTERAGNYFELKLKGTRPTVPTKGFKEDAFFTFPKGDVNGGPVTMQFLKHLQTIAKASVREKQEAALHNNRDFIATGAMNPPGTTTLASRERPPVGDGVGESSDEGID